MANEKFSPKFFLEREMQARGRCTNGASRKDLWRDASLYLRIWCVKSASQEVVREVAESLLEENCEERALTLVKNPPFANQVYRGKYETSVGEPYSLSRDWVRPTYGMNDVRSDLLWNQLLKVLRYSIPETSIG